MNTINVSESGSWHTVQGLRSDYGTFKGPHNTGLPENWQPVQRISGRTLSVADAVYEDIEFLHHGVVIDAPNVVLRRCKFGSVRNNGMHSGVIIEDSLANFINLTYLTVRRCEITGSYGDLLRAGSEGYIEDSWLHSPEYTYGAHLDIWQTLGMTNGSLLRCRLDFGDMLNANACMQFSANIHNLLVQNNYFNGGGYVLSGVPSGSNIGFSGNVWGPTRNFSPVYPGLKTASGVVWDASNVLESSGAAV